MDSAAMVKTVRSWLIGIAVLFAVAIGAPATDMGHESISITVGGITKFIYLPIKLAEQLGYFEDEGLSVELISRPSGVDVETELLAGAVQAVAGSYDHTIDLQSRGKDVRAIVTLLQVPGEVEVVSNATAIKSMADVRGRTLGVTGLGSATDFLTRYLALKSGVVPGTYATLPVGAGASFIAAMKQRRIDAGMTTEPTASRLIESGEATVLVDLRTIDGTRTALGGIYPFTCLYVDSRWLASHRSQAARLAHALSRAMAYIHTHAAEDIAGHMPPTYYEGNKALYVRALKATKSMYTPDGRMPEGGPQHVLAVLSVVDASVKWNQIDLRRTYTDEFVTAPSSIAEDLDM